MIENYCHLISERLVVVETHSKECPEELKEAISSLIFAAARCGDLPELQEMKRLFTSRYGKEFTARATELRNHCGVHPGVRTYIPQLIYDHPVRTGKFFLQKYYG
ncbi:unnamed protein product [Linum tenue]|uniref:Uncharacterized protein n=1 Tax=Linum tenue TaxID=586396 RepID=A0AAV0MY11_9ROSI|nr:unnamed protein product [Linum tenue]